MEWIEKLDKQSPCFHSVLHFSDCTLKGGEAVKDLSRLNRPLHNIILVTSTPSHAAYQPRNALFLQSWDGDDDDMALLDTFVFLQCERVSARSPLELTLPLDVVRNHNPVQSDVRTILSRFSGHDAAEAHRETRAQYFDQILRDNQRTKAMLAGLKRTAPGAAPSDRLDKALTA